MGRLRYVLFSNVVQFETKVETRIKRSAEECVETKNEPEICYF